MLANPRIVARRRFQSSGRRHRNRSGGFCCFSPPKSREKKRVFPKAVKGFREVFCCFSPSKSREKSFPKFYAESLRGFREVAVPTNFFLLVLLGPKVPKASARRSPRECASRGAARGAQDRSLSATPWRTRRSPPPLFPRQTKVRIRGAANGGIIIWQCASDARINLLFLKSPPGSAFLLVSRKAIPDLVPMAGKRTEG